MSEPLDLEALERRHANYTAHGVPRLSQDEFGALLARIRELEAERPDWSDADIDRFNDECERIARTSSVAMVAGELTAENLTAHLREQARSALRAAGIVPNVARWRPISKAPTRTFVLVAFDDGRRPEVSRHDKASHIPLYGWLDYSTLDGEDIEFYRDAPTHWQPLPAPPTTEAT
jgi:hypothetical protein